MPSGLHRAVWDGPFIAELADMTTLAPGEEHLVSDEDLKSAHWKPAGRKPKAKTDDEGEKA